MIFSYTSIILTVIALVAFRFIKDRYYPYLIYLIALVSIYSTTMLGLGVVGSDISMEASFARDAYNSGWDIGVQAPEITSVVVGVIVPVIAKVLFIDIVWVFKLVLPLIFALCPVILYLAYSKQVEKWKAFIGAMFFIIMPVFSLEIATIGKSMVAETFLAVAIYAVITNWKQWIKFLVITISLALALWSHYSVGIIGLLMFLVIGICIFVVKYLKNWKLWQYQNTKSWVILVSVVLVACVGFGYYSVAGQGTIAKSVNGIGVTYYNLKTNIDKGWFKFIDIKQPEKPKVVSTPSSNVTKTVSVPKSNVTVQQNIVQIAANKTASITIPEIKPIQVKDTYLNRQPPLIRTALGLDFTETTDKGKAFRVIQLITQALIVIGCVGLLFRYKKYRLHAEFIAGVVAGLGILLLCIVIPNLSAILNATRFYHLSLFFLALMFPLGIDVISDVLGVIWKKFR